MNHVIVYFLVTVPKGMWKGYEVLEALVWAFLCRKYMMSSIPQRPSEVGFRGIRLCDNHLLRYGIVPSWF